MQRDRTWIDAASDFVVRAVGQSGTDHSDHPFTQQQQKLLQELLKSFGTEIGKLLGEQLCRVTDKLELQVASLRDQVEVKFDSPIVASCGKEATVYGEATNQYMSNLKNVKRKARRNKAKQKAILQKSMILRLRPATELSDLCKSKPDSVSDHFDVVQRLDALEAWVNTSLHLWYPSSVDGWSGDPVAGVRSHCFPEHCGAFVAQDLALQCRSVVAIQRAWRKHHCENKQRLTPPALSIRPVQLDPSVEYLLGVGRSRSTLKIYRFRRVGTSEQNRMSSSQKSECEAVRGIQKSWRCHLARKQIQMGSHSRPDFRSLPMDAWMHLHARFRTESNNMYGSHALKADVLEPSSHLADTSLPSLKFLSVQDGLACRALSSLHGGLFSVLLDYWLESRGIYFNLSHEADLEE